MNIPFNKIKEIALALVSCNQNRRYKHFSFILDKNYIISIGLNRQDKTHPLTKKYRYMSSNLHSELAACVKLGIEDASDLIIVNARINHLNKFCNSFPCIGCRNLIKQLNFKEVWATNHQGEFKRV